MIRVQICRRLKVPLMLAMHSDNNTSVNKTLACHTLCCSQEHMTLKCKIWHHLLSRIQNARANVSTNPFLS